MIPRCVTAEHVREAVRRIDKDGLPPKNKGRGHCLVVGGRHFPPKYTIALAYQAATGYILDVNQFCEGGESENFLRSHNFDVVKCDCGGHGRDTVPGRQHAGTPHGKSPAGGRTHPDAAGRPGQAVSTLRVAMVFPKLKNGWWPSGTIRLDAFAGEDVDFALFPEAYIDMSKKRHVKSLKKLASGLGAPLLVGATGDNDAQVLLRFDPDGSDPTTLYTKHSSAGTVAFGMQDWNPQDMLPTFELGGVRAGATICHDSYLGLLQRRLAGGGTRVWLNPSFDNVVDIKWSSVLRLRAVENRFYALCTLHHNKGRHAKTHPFAFAPDGSELYARRAGSAEKRPISECTEADAVYITELDILSAGRPLDWSGLPRAAKPQTQNKKPKKPLRISLRDGRPAVYTGTGWNGSIGGRIQTEHGIVCIGAVPNKRILDAATCFGALDHAHKLGCRPIIWNHWDMGLPTESGRLASLMMGRVIECSAPIVISDQTGIKELVELANNYKNPVRRIVDSSGVVVDVAHARGLGNAFGMVTKCVPAGDRTAALERYRSLGSDENE